MISWHSNFEIIPDLSSEEVARRSFYFQMSIGVCRLSSPLSLEKTSAHSQYFYVRSSIFFTIKRVLYSSNKAETPTLLKVSYRRGLAVPLLFVLSLFFPSGIVRPCLTTARRLQRRPKQLRSSLPFGPPKRSRTGQGTDRWRLGHLETHVKCETVQEIKSGAETSHSSDKAQDTVLHNRSVVCISK